VGELAGELDEALGADAVVDDLDRLTEVAAEEGCDFRLGELLGLALEEALHLLLVARMALR
jgi:hypothetical protein